MALHKVVQKQANSFQLGIFLRLWTKKYHIYKGNFLRTGTFSIY